MPKASRNSAMAGLVLLLLTAFVYLPGLGGGFIFDDYPNIVTNPRVHAETVDWTSIKAAATGYEAGGSSRPVATISFAVDHALAGKAPRQYKVTSLAVHLVNALLIWRLLCSLQRFSPQFLGTRAAAPLILALLWAIHPLQVSTVLYVVQRMETLALMFVLLALLAYLRGRRLQGDGKRGWPWLAACLPLVGLGLLCKETAGLFPVYALALEITVLGFKSGTDAGTRRWRVAYAIATIAAAIVFVAWVLPLYANPGAYAHRDFDVVGRLLTQFQVLPMYLGMILLPSPGGYVFYYDDLVAAQGLLSPSTTLLGALAMAGLLTAAVWARKRLPMFSLGVFWFLGGHLLTSNVVALELAFEHRNYFALLGVLLATYALLERLAGRLGLSIGAKQMIAGSLVVGLGAICLLRAATWGDPLLLAMDLVTRNQASARASNDMAEQFMVLSDMNKDSPFFSLGIQEFERGARLASASTLPEQGLIMMSALASAPVKKEWWDSLEQKLESRPIGPQEVGTISLMLKQRYAGLPLDDRRLADAYAELAERTPLKAYQYAELGDHAINFADDPELANRMFGKAVLASRDDPGYISQMIQVLSDDGHMALAQNVRRHAATLGITTTAATPRDDNR